MGDTSHMYNVSLFCQAPTCIGRKVLVGSHGGTSGLPLKLILMAKRIHICRRNWSVSIIVTACTSDRHLHVHAECPVKNHNFLS